MSSNTQNWKNAESLFAKVLQEFKIPAVRKTSRAGNFGLSDYDVEIEGHSFFKGDSKYTKAAPFKHHGLLKTIEAKYCKEPGDEAVLYTRNYKERKGVISVDDRFFAMLLSYYLGFGEKGELMEVFNARS